jgi:rod shape-determining protein MreC
MRISVPVKAAAQRLTLPFLIFVSIMLVIFGKTDALLYDGVRVALVDRIAPVLQAISQPFATVAGGFHAISEAINVHRDNAELREENARLLQWQEVARRLAAENAELRQLVKLVPQNEVNAVAARVIADSGGAFARNVLVNVGRDDGVQRGQAAMTGEGLVGRVAEVGGRTARVLLLTDLNSHIPVELEDTHERAVLDGDNSEEPRLVYLPQKAEVRVGQRIVTGGAGGVFPPGLPVGVVSSVTGDIIRVEPYAELARLELVRIVDFGLSGVLPQSAVPLPRVTGRGRAAAPDATR